MPAARSAVTTSRLADQRATLYDIAGWHEGRIVLVVKDLRGCFTFNRRLVIQEPDGSLAPAILDEADLHDGRIGQWTSEDGTRRLVDTEPERRDPHPIQLVDAHGALVASFLGVGDSPAWNGNVAAMIAYTDADRSSRPRCPLRAPRVA